VTTTPQANPLRIVLAKVGLDGHDRGIKVVARALRDAGMEVIYAGLWQTPEAVVRTVADEDADWLGLSLLSGAHMTLVPRVVQLLKEAGLEHVGVLVGGIVPEADIPKLAEMGVARVFGPGTAMEDIVSFLRQRSEAHHG
jgi:methylmalonyl-CoA mutase cobalamin-binding domain/chain